MFHFVDEGKRAEQAPPLRCEMGSEDQKGEDNENEDEKDKKDDCGIALYWRFRSLSWILHDVFLRLPSGN